MHQTTQILNQTLSNLDYSHVQTSFSTELFSDVSCRLGAVVVSPLKRLQLLGCDRCAWSLVGVVEVKFGWRFGGVE